MLSKNKQVLIASLIGSLASASALGGEILVNNVDAADVGFNDTTPAIPVGGNAGTTIGEQRLLAYEFAAQRWQDILQPDNDIVVQATFAPLPCDADGGVLGAAGTIQVFANFPAADASGAPGALWPETWSHGALSNQLAGEDLTAGAPDPGLLAPPFNDDIVSFFNGDIDNNDECLQGSDWYYGLDNLPEPGQIDFLNVLMHELGHGLGFSNFIDEENGQAFSGRPDVFNVFTRNESTGKKLNQQNNGERESSAINSELLAWTGPNVTTGAAGLLAGRPAMIINSPAGLAGVYDVQEASYGAALTDSGVTGDIVLWDDGVGDGNDACDTAVFDDDGNLLGFEPPVNVADIPGKIALINRGACAFVLKSLAAEVFGAVGVIIANNQPSGRSPMGGDPIGLTTPSIGITRDEGDAIKANIPVNVTIGRNPDPAKKAGATEEGYLLIYAPNPVESGSSGSHFDVSASPNLLMEPFISVDLKAATDVDLTDDLMQDVGWDKQLYCPGDSDDRAEISVDGCLTGVENLQGPYTTRFRMESQGVGNGTMNIVGGCYLQDLVNACTAGSTTGTPTSCIAGVTGDLVRDGVIDHTQAGAIRACVD